MSHLPNSYFLRPFLVVPKLIIQPTWGGSYIAKLKNWENIISLQDKRIGQSYELFGNSKLMVSVTDSQDKRFIPEIGFPDRAETLMNEFPLQANVDFISLHELCFSNQEMVVGKKVQECFGKMPLLIKINQANGNSFQLHVRPKEMSERWKPKAESWYYFEPGLLTFGIKKGISVEEYRHACLRIEKEMQELSMKVISGVMGINNARQRAKEFIHSINPWQYVNTHSSSKHEVIDLSMGGVHHSWEENLETHPMGNVLYEVQEDVMDQVCTVRCFDQGKLKDTGEVRELNISDYFQYLDTDEFRNSIENAKQKPNKNRVLTTQKYVMDAISVKNRYKDETHSSFVHLFVREGDINVSTIGGLVRVSSGHSCFLPYHAGQYTIESISSESTVLKTYIE